MDIDGNHISHTLTHNRVRRSTTGSSTALLGLRAHGHEFRLSLEDTTPFLATTFAVKRRRRSTTSGQIEEVPEQSSGLDCHFTARMVSHQNKSTGVSVCGGSVVSNTAKSVALRNRCKMDYKVRSKSEIWTFLPY